MEDVFQDFGGIEQAGSEAKDFSIGLFFSSQSAGADLAMRKQQKPLRFQGKMWRFLSNVPDQPISAAVVQLTRLDHIPE